MTWTPSSPSTPPPTSPSFRAAVQKLDVPAQNFVYADIDGHIGYQAPGRIPIRNGDLPSEPVPADGTWPMPGWDSRYDWKGYLPTSQLPYTEDPQEGFIVAANQAVTAPGDGPTLTHDFDYGYRSQRIRDLLQADVSAHRQLQVEDMQAIQLDTRNGIAADLVPILLKEKVGDAFTQQAIDLLKTWDYTQPADSAAAAYFNAVWAELLDLTFADELPPGTRPDGGARWAEVIRQLLKDPQDPWWDDRRTPNVVETRDEILRQALVQARLTADQRAGQGPGHLALGAAAPAPARRAAAGRRRADRAAAPAAQPRADDHAGRAGHRRRQRLRRLVGHLRRHLGALDAHGRRPLRLRPVDLGQPDRRVRAPGPGELRRPARRVGRRRHLPVAVHAGAVNAAAAQTLTISPGPASLSDGAGRPVRRGRAGAGSAAASARRRPARRAPRDGSGSTAASSTSSSWTTAKTGTAAVEHRQGGVVVPAALSEPGAEGVDGERRHEHDVRREHACRARGSAPPARGPPRPRPGRRVVARCPSPTPGRPAGPGAAGR